MSASFLLALSLMGISLLVLRLRLGRRWLIHPFTMFAFVAFIYHGLSEVIIRLNLDPYAVMQRPDRIWLDKGMLVAAASLFAATLGYCLVTPVSKVRPFRDLPSLVKVVDWRILAIVSLPMVLATIKGNGIFGSSRVDGSGLTAAGLSYQFLGAFVTLTAFAFLLRHPRQWLLAMTLQSVVLALSGQRMGVVAGLVTVAILMARVGMKAPRLQVLASLAVLIVILAGLTGLRAAGDRSIFREDSGLEARLSAIASGVTATDDAGYQGAASNNVFTDAAIRLDSNAWGGQVAERLARAAPLGPAPLWNTVLLTIPSVIYRAKTTSLTAEQRNTEGFIVSGLNLDSYDYLPGHVLTYYGAFSGWQNVAVLLLFGLVFGFIERWTLHRNTISRLVGYFTLLGAALSFESGLTVFLFAARGAIVISLLLYVWSILGPAASLRRRRRRKGPPQWSGGQTFLARSPSASAGGVGVSPVRR